MKLNLGCGLDYRKGYVNLEHPEVNIKCDIKHDLNRFPYPFKADQFEEVICRNLIEHLKDPERVMKELHRISKNRALIKIIVPHFSCADTWGDIQHVRGFSSETFAHENLKHLFSVVKQRIKFPKRRFFIEPVFNKFNGLYEHNFAYIFPAETLNVVLKVKKLG